MISTSDCDRRTWNLIRSTQRDNGSSVLRTTDRYVPITRVSPTLVPVAVVRSPNGP